MDSWPEECGCLLVVVGLIALIAFIKVAVQAYQFAS
jgi:hypothetical protein